MSPAAASVPAIAALLFSAAPMAGPASAAPCALVSAQDGGTVGVVDCASRTITARIPVGDLPVGLAVDAAAGRLYVTRPDRGAIDVVDLRGCRRVGTFSDLGTPFGVAASGGRLLVTDWSGDRLLALDPRDGKVLNATATGRAPAGLAVDETRGRVFVAEREADSVGVFDLADLAPRGAVAVGRAPFAVAVDGERVVAVNVRSAAISLIDAESLAVSATVPVGQMPYAAVGTGAGRLLVTNQQSGTVSVVAPGEGGSFRVENAKVGAYPEGIALVDGGRFALVANWFSDDVRLLDPATGATVATITTDAGPRMVVAVDGPVCGDAAD